MDGRKPRILHINTVCNSRSTGYVAEGIGEAATRRGWESHIAYGLWPKPSKMHTLRIGNFGDTLWHVAETRLLDRHGLASRKATASFLEKAARLAPDIIHLHNIHGYYINYPMLFRFLKDYGRPVVWTLHDCWTFTGHCPHFELAGCYRWREQCHDCPNKSLYPGSWVADRSRKNFEEKKKWFTSLENATIVPVSEWLAGHARESFLGKYRVKAIHNGIDTAVFQESNGAKTRVAEKYGLAGGKLVACVASTWDMRKGLADVVKLRDRLPDDYNILVVGLSPKQVKSMPPGIRGMVRTESVEALVDIYSAADAFFNPTLEEALSLVNLEAQSCGTPVVTYRAGGTPETVDNGVTGHVTARHDLDTAAAAIKTTCSGGKEPYSGKCRAWVEKNFAKEKKYEEYMEIYSALLDGGGA